METGAPAGGAWGLTAVMVIIASWVLYRYVAPKGWREWSRAGIVQAFIIALYAEMYGFPLTLYLLSGFFGIDIPILHNSGHLWAALFNWGILGAIVEMLVGYTLVFFGLSILIEGWREVYVATRNKQLATDGLYGVVRHPQYTGIFLAIFGQLIHWPTIPTLVIFPIMVWAYYRLSLREEKQMLKQFGTVYEDYMKNRPMFLPHKGEWKRLINVSR